MKKRIIYSDNGTLSDLSVSMDDYNSGTSAFTLVAAQDAFYIGSILPFNHIYIKFSGNNVNANASVLTVSYWDSSEFREVVDLIDETSSGGATFAQSGYITWSTDKDHGWIREDTNYGGNQVDGLTSLEIYDMYWCKLTFSADLTANTTLSWMGQKFSNDNDLKGEHSDLVRSGFLTAFESGKTDWEEQHIIAAELISDDLIAKGIILEPEQLLCKEDLRRASVKKVAQIIYNSMGSDYTIQRDEAKAEYENRINKLLPKIDSNINGRLDVNERAGQGRLYR